MFVGIDWANESHDICVVDPAGKIRGRATIAHSQEGFDELTKHLGRWAEQREILVGIERPEGRLVDRILEAGHPIVLIPTFAMKDLRRRYAVGGAKSDPGDAYVIADVTRTDGHRLRRLEPLSEETRALRSVVRARGDLVDQRVALGNQLRACLQAYWPGAAVIFADVCSEIALDAEVFTSLPQSGRINAAQMLAEWGDCREAYPCPDAVSMLGGLCPVTHASGKHRDLAFRWACNKRLREAITTFADNSRHASPWAADIYRRAIARGCDHPHAVRILAKAWVRVIWRCWQDRRPYDPALHGAAVLLEAA